MQINAWAIKTQNLPTLLQKVKSCSVRTQPHWLSARFPTLKSDRGYPGGVRSRRLLGLVLVLGALASIPAASSASNDPFLVGFSDIAPEGANGAAVASTAAAIGATMQLTPGLSSLRLLVARRHDSDARAV